MSNVDYSCQKDIRSNEGILVVPETVTVVGTGGFGAWVAFFAARAGVRKLVLINPTNKNGTGDPEDIGGREIAIGPFVEADLGHAKVDALAASLAEARHGVVIVTHKLVFKPGEHDSLLEGVVFAGVSNEIVLAGIFAAARVKGLHCFSGFYSGTKFGVISQTPREFPKIIGRQPVWVGSAAMSALMAVNAAFVEPINFFGEISDLDTGFQQTINILKSSASDL